MWLTCGRYTADISWRTNSLGDKCLFEGYQTVHSHCDKFESLRVCMEHTKSELQKQVKLQQQLLDVEVKQLDKMPTVAYTAVDKGFANEKTASVLSEEKLKKFVQEAVTEQRSIKKCVGIWTV